MDVIKAAVRLGLNAQTTPAVSVGETCYTYAQLLHASLYVFNQLKSLPASKQDQGSEASKIPGSLLNNARVGIIAKPCAEFVAGVWATWLCGGIAVPLALSYPEAELSHVLTDADVSVVLSTPDYQAKLEEVTQKALAQLLVLPEVGHELNRSDENGTVKSSFEQVLDQVASLDNSEGMDPGLIIYTSGTTGKPKGVVHTHAGMNAQVKMLSQAWEYTTDDRFLHCLPLHHVHGLFNSLLGPLYAGAMVEFLPKFSVRGVWKKWSESYPADGVNVLNATTVFTGVPTMYAYLLKGYKEMDESAKTVAARAARHLRLMMCGSSALPQTVMTEWEALTGHRLLERYGMTEFVMALSNPYNEARKAGTVGKPLPGVEVKIAEDDAAAPGVGELYVKSPSLFIEYWRKPEVTRDAFDKDGFFKTGDSVTMDSDGYYIILGRTTVDILKVGGFKISALEIESVLLQHPAIAECAVVGLPDVYYGEVICAVVIVDSSAKADGPTPPLTVSSLKEWAKDMLASYKIPSKLVIWESMPRNAMGKVNKKELQKLLL